MPTVPAVSAVREPIAAPVGARRVRLAVALGALVSFGPLSLDFYLPGLPGLGRDLDASASAAQLTLTACLAGLALGQLVAGPLSDRLGRRGPLVGGVLLYALASVACAAAPSIAVLVVLRLVQGLAGAAGIVIGRAVVRDLLRGDEAARFFSNLLLVNGLAPILAPVLGAQLLAATDWRGLFAVLAAVGAALAVLALVAVPESLPPDRRRAGGLAEAGRALRTVAADRRFVGHALTGGLAMAAMFAYIAGSPFVLQDLHGLSPQAFSAAFALNGLGIVVGSQATGRLAGRVPTSTLLRWGVGQLGVGAGLLLAAVLVGGLGVWSVLVPLLLVVSSIGVINPTTVVLALEDHGDVAGSASALLGVGQFLLGAVAAPLVGIAGTGTAVPMGLLIALCALGALAARRLTLR